MKVMEAIRRRRSIRKFKSTPLTKLQLDNLMEAARLAPSGCNVQPWRFIIIRNVKLKQRLQEAAFGLQFIAQAPVVIVCCGDLRSWKKTKEHTEEILQTLETPLNKACKKALMERVERAVQADVNERIPTTLMNVAIAIEHIVLEAVELGLGSCWVRIFDAESVRDLLALPRYFYVVALLPIGRPDEQPDPRPRLPLSRVTREINREPKRKGKLW
jgi:nitroreductase